MNTNTLPQVPLQIAVDTVTGITSKQVAFIEKLMAEVEANIENMTSQTAKNAVHYIKVAKKGLADGTMSKRNGSQVIENLIRFNKTNYLAHEEAALERANRVLAPIGVYKHDNEIYRVVKVRGGSDNRYAQKLSVIEGRNPQWLSAHGYVWKLKVEELISPQVAAQMGRATGYCVICGRHLSDEESVAKGIGPICAQRYEVSYAEAKGN